MKRTNFYFSEELLLRVKNYATAEGLTSSEVIRSAIDDYLLRKEQRATDVRVLNDAMQVVQAGINQLVEAMNEETRRRTMIISYQTAARGNKD